MVNQRLSDGNQKRKQERRLHGNAGALSETKSVYTFFAANRALKKVLRENIVASFDVKYCVSVSNR